METDTLRKTVGARIEQARTARGLTQAEIARMLGMSASGYRKWIYGISVVSVDDLWRLSEILGQPMAYFVAEEKPAEDGHGIHLARKIGRLDMEGRHLVEGLVERILGDSGKSDGEELVPVIASQGSSFVPRTLAFSLA